MVPTAAKSASYNMIFQLIFRILTFVMNAVLLRYITKEMLGIVNVRLSLLYYTIIFISSEAFRKSCLVRDTHAIKEENRKKLINLIWMCVVVGVVTSIVLSIMWIFYLGQPPPGLVYHYRLCTIAFATSTVIELLAEPLRLFGQSYSFIRLKVISEGVMVTTRCVVSVTLVIFFPHLGILSFAVGYLISSLLYTLTYYAYFSNYVLRMSQDDIFSLKTVRDFFPSMDTDSAFDTEYKALVITFYKQSLIKQFLTEGEKYMMTLFNILSFGEQGVYDVINNLGSLAARVIFMPIEESCHVYFSQLLTRGKSGKDHDSGKVEVVAQSLCMVLKVVSMIGLIVFVFGYSYSYLLLQLYGGSMLTDNEGPTLLRTYSFYVLVIAINGVTECFMFAAMDQSELSRYNYKMVLFSVVFTMASLLLTSNLGAVGFIFANCVNMFLRIVSNIRYISNFFQDTHYRPLRDAIPSPSACGTLMFSFIVTSISERHWCCSHGFVNIVLHVGVGFVCLLLVVITFIITEPQLFQYLRAFIGKLSQYLHAFIGKLSQYLHAFIGKLSQYLHAFIGKLSQYLHAFIGKLSQYLHAFIGRSKQPEEKQKTS